MTKHRPSPSKAVGREQQFEELLTSMGIGESTDGYSRFALTQNLEGIERYYAHQVAVLGKQPDRKLVRRYRAAITKVLALSEKIGPDFFANEIEKVNWSRQNPDADDMTLHMLMEEYGDKRDKVIVALTVRRLDIDDWLKTSADVYRKRIVTKLVVEPFLQLVAQCEITTSRKQPRTRMFKALFDWLGIEQKFRSSSATINGIARDLAGASSSEANAKRRPKN